MFLDKPWTIFFLKGTPKSPIPNETKNQRGFAVVSISGVHNDATTSKKGTNKRIQ